MSYTKTNWQNTPSTQTPISAANLNHMEQGIADNNVAIPTQAEVSSGSIVFKNGNNTTVFSVALPVYNGEVS